MPKFDESAMLAAIRRVMSEHGGGEAITSRVYEQFFKRGSEPSPKVIAGHFGSWAEAVQRAQAERLGAAYDAVRTTTNDTIAAQRQLDVATQRAAFVRGMDDAVRPANDVASPPSQLQSRTAFIVGDIHLNAEHLGFWPAFKAMIKHRRPHTLIFNGDIIDAEILSAWPKRPDTPPHVIEEIRRAIAEINELAACVVDCVFIPGNHDLRWETAVGGAHAMALKGAVGLSLREQFYAQGLDPRVRWVQETNGVPGYRFAETRARHGHNQAKRGGFGAKHLAAKYLAEEWVSTATNHHHVAQMVCRTVIDIDDRVRTVQSMTIPCATRPHDYWLHPNWQWGAGVIESFGPDYRRSSNYVIVADPETGTFSYGGTTYLGNAKPMNARAV